MASYHLCALF